MPPTSPSPPIGAPSVATNLPDMSSNTPDTAGSPAPPGALQNENGEVEMDRLALRVNAQYESVSQKLERAIGEIEAYLAASEARRLSKVKSRSKSTTPAPARQNDFTTTAQPPSPSTLPPNPAATPDHPTEPTWKNHKLYTLALSTHTDLSSIPPLLQHLTTAITSHKASLVQHTRALLRHADDVHEHSLSQHRAAVAYAAQRRESRRVSGISRRLRGTRAGRGVRRLVENQRALLREHDDLAAEHKVHRRMLEEHGEGLREMGRMIVAARAPILVQGELVERKLGVVGEMVVCVEGLFEFVRGEEGKGKGKRGKGGKEGEGGVELGLDADEDGGLFVNQRSPAPEQEPKSKRARRK